MTPPPAALLAMAALVAAGACLVGVLVERARSRREVEQAAIRARQADAEAARWRDGFSQANGLLGILERELDAAERGNAELREAIPKVWDAGVAAARQMCQQHHIAALQVWELPAEFVEQLRSNRRAN